MSRYISKPTLKLWNAAKHILRYLKHTIDYGLYYHKGQKSDPRIIGYSDSDWAQEKPLRKSITGYKFFYSGSIITCTSKQKSFVAQSSVESEIIALSMTIRELLWIKKLDRLLSPLKQTVSIKLKKDNQGCLTISKNGIINDRTKHISVKEQMAIENIKNEPYQQTAYQLKNKFPTDLQSR